MCKRAGGVYLGVIKTHRFHSLCAQNLLRTRECASPDSDLAGGQKEDTEGS